MRALSISFLALPVAVCALFGAGCEDPEPDNNNFEPVIRLAPERTSVAVDTTIAIKVTTPGTNDITLSVTTDDAAVQAGVAVPSQGPGGTAVQPPDADGVANFEFTCLGGAGAVTVTASSEGEDDRSISINCFIPVDNLRLALRNVNCANQLIADGQSSCDIKATVRDAEGNLAANRIVTAIVDETSIVTAGPKALDPAFINGVPEMLTASGLNPQARISVTTDENGEADFKVVSPVFELEQTFNITCVVGNATEVVQVVIQPFADLTDLKITADPANVVEGGTSTIRVTAKGANGFPASNATVALSANLGFVLADTTVTTDELGVGETTVIAPAVDAAAVTGKVTASFDSLPGEDAGARTVSVDVTSTPEGAANANVSQFDVQQISLDTTAPSQTAKLVILATQDNDAFENVTVEVRVAAVSNRIITIDSVTEGDAGTPVTLNNGTVSGIDDGRLEVVVAPFDATSIGLAAVQIIVRNNVDNAILQNVERQLEVLRAPRATSLRFLAFDPADGVIGTPGGPLGSSVSVSFELRDDSNNVLSGKRITFEVASSAPPRGITPSVVNTDANGIATTTITAGDVATPITVTATHLIDVDDELVASSTPIVVVGGVPNSAYSALSCATTAAFDPFSTECTVALADRFTDVVETDTNVQFRAEGGNVTASAVASGGTASTTFTFSEPGPGSADIRQWSYSPLRNATSTIRAEFPECFDSTTSTPCNLIELCQPQAGDAADLIAQKTAFCPLPPSTLAAVNNCSADISATTLDAIDDENADPADWALELFFNIDAVVGVNVAAQFEAYTDEHRACGIPVSCLTGQLNGLTLDPSDDCPINPGCLDYSGATECPQNGLLQVLAAVRGEEGFDDVNGDGIRGATEDFIDYPEPFLDKNSSCSYDSLNDLPPGSLSANEKVRLSDQFIDSGDDGAFGFNGAETNGVFDRDTEVFVTTSIVHLAGSRVLQFGEVGSIGDCGANNAGTTACSAPIAGNSTCTETSRSHFDGSVILGGCSQTDPNDFREGDAVTFGFRWTDANGNCPTENFAGQPTVTVNGPAKIFPDDDAYSAAECGAAVGGIFASNPERPWCEEHPVMGSPIRRVTVQADCGGEEGVEIIELIFELDGITRKKTIAVGCPVCGDDLVEGEEQCDEGAANGGTSEGDCDAECQIVPAG